VKLAYAYAEFARARERMVAARREVATCALSGAVGTFANVDPRPPRIPPDWAKEGYVSIYASQKHETQARA